MIVISNISPDRIDEAVEVMLTAFKDEALTSSWLDLSFPELKNAYALAVKIIYIVHLDSGDPIYTAIEKDKIVGVAAISTPFAKKNKSKSAILIIKKLPRLLRLIPLAAKAARLLYAATKPPASLPKNYCTLEILAVDPGCQGKGIGRQLLDHVHRNHFDENTISGIYLVTGDEKNVKIYERFGYEVVDRRHIKSIVSNHMFKIAN
jgi:ribosomal protein S18 acetylase RimI-like enzyme